LLKPLKKNSKEKPQAINKKMDYKKEASRLIHRFEGQIPLPHTGQGIEMDLLKKKQYAIACVLIHMEEVGKKTEPCCGTNLEYQNHVGTLDEVKKRFDLIFEEQDKLK